MSLASTRRAIARSRRRSTIRRNASRCLSKRRSTAWGFPSLISMSSSEVFPESGHMKDSFGSTLYLMTKLELVPSPYFEQFVLVSPLSIVLEGPFERMEPPPRVAADEVQVNSLPQMDLWRAVFHG